jgi:hypothetical protein
MRGQQACVVECDGCMSVCSRVCSFSGVVCNEQWVMQAKRAAGRGSTRRKRPLFGGEPDESANGTSNAKAFKFGFTFSE